MLVPSMRGDKQGMAVLVVEQEERPAAQDHTQTPDQSAGEEHVTVNGLAMTIHITGQGVRLLSSLSFSGRMPELCGPGREGIGETFGPIGAGAPLDKKASV